MRPVQLLLTLALLSVTVYGIPANQNDDQLMCSTSIPDNQQPYTKQHRYPIVSDSLPDSSLQNDLMMIKQHITRRPVRLGCILGNCLGRLFSCLLDWRCNQMLRCLSKCDLPFSGGRGFFSFLQSSSKDDDGIREARSQRCSIRCVLRPIHTPAISAFLGCLTGNQCLLPPPHHPPGPECPLPRHRLQTFQYPQDILGKWWVSRGLSVVYDCWPCQSMDFSVNNNSSSSSISTTNISDDYNYSGSDGDVRLRYDYAMHIDNDLPRSIPCTVQPFTTTSSTDAAVNIEEIGHLTTHYTVAELFSGTDDWHVLDRTEDNRYMLIYYCGTGELSPDKYQGAVVMIKDGWQLSDVPGTILDRFTNVLHGAGLSQLDTRQFCVNHLNHC